MRPNWQEELKAKFDRKDLEWRVGQAGVKNGKPWAVILAYVDARAIMDRLDEVVGPENWTDSYDVLPGGMMCTLAIKTPENGWVHKTDGSPETAVESFKGGFSKALVRTAVKWGIGRYLYDIPTQFADFVEKKGKNSVRAKIDNNIYWWNPPT